MGENTNIEWATHTFNPWVGCTKIVDTKTGAPSACDFCYAEVWSRRSGTMNSCAVRFSDGYTMVTSRNAIRRANQQQGRKHE